VFAEKTHADAVFGTKAHQERTARNIAETDNAAYRMNGQPQADLFFDLDSDCLAFLGEIGALRGDKKGIEMFFHDSPVMR